MDVIDKARELGELLVDSPEFKRFQEAERRQLNDTEAQLAMERYNEKKNELMQELSREDITAEELEAVREHLVAELNMMTKNEVVHEFIEASNAFGEVITKVNGVISFFIKGDVQGESSGCGGCSGCGSGTQSTKFVVQSAKETEECTV